MVVGTKYKVKQDHPHWPGQIGVFEFFGGPNADVVVLNIKTVGSTSMGWISKSYACVDQSAIESIIGDKT